MTIEEMIGRRASTVSEIDFEQKLYGLGSAFEQFREQVYQRGGVFLAQKNIEVLKAFHRDVADMLNDLADSMKCQRAAE